MQVSREQFQEWRHHPVTEAVNKYLRDFRALMMEQWAAGDDMGPVEQKQAQQLGDLAELQYDALVEFYEPEKAEKEQDEQKL